MFKDISIKTFSVTTAYKYGNALEQLHHLRYKTFILKEKYNVPHYNQIEFDQYDNPLATYIAITKGERVIAGARFNHTDFTYQLHNTNQNNMERKINVSYMVKDIWGNVIPKKYLASSANVHELTRFCVDEDLPRVMKAYVSVILASAIYIHCSNVGITQLLFITSKNILNILNNMGVKIKTLVPIQMESFTDIHLTKMYIVGSNVYNVINYVLNKTGFDLAVMLEQQHEDVRVAA